MTVREAWLDARIAGAPATLAERVRAFLDDDAAARSSDRLAVAGRRALEAAEARGSERAAALDLLAADALITLALLDVAEHVPARLGVEAARLREQAAGDA